MRFSLRTISIAGALLVSIGLITAAYVISGTTNQADAANADELLRAYATKDTDSDGLPDWQEKLYDTDPENAHSVDAKMTDSEAVAAGLVKPRFESEEIATSTISVDSVPGVTAAPGTVTDEFSRLFFQRYLELQATGVKPTTDQLLGFIDDSVNELYANNQITRAYSASNVKISGTGADALRAYAANADHAFMLNSGGPSQDPMYYFSKVVYNNDKTALSYLKQLSKDYATIDKAFVKIPAPGELSAIHLRFANAMALMSKVVSDFAAVNDDPVRSFLVLGQYNIAAQELTASILAYHDAYAAAGVEIAPDAQGYQFYSLLNNTFATSELVKQNATP